MSEAPHGQQDQPGSTRVHTAFREALAGVPLHGVTTSLGVLTPAGVRNEGQMLFADERP